MKNQMPPFEHRPPAEFDVPNSTIHLRLFRHGDEDNLVRLVDDEPVQRFVPWAKLSSPHFPQHIDTVIKGTSPSPFSRAYAFGDLYFSRPCGLLSL